MPDHPRSIPLLLQLAHAIRQRHVQTCADYGLTFQQFNVLRILAGAERRGEGPLPKMEIARRLIEPGPGITRFIKQLSAMQLIDVHPNPVDDRSKLCALTEEGSAKLAALEPAIRTLVRELFAKFDETEQTQLNELLKKVNC